MKKDIDKATEYFKKATLEDYVYAHNNLGKLFEEKGELEKAYNHYMFSCSLEESWACNKMGLWYKDGIYVTKNLKKSFEYFNKAISVPKDILDYWAYYNLAKYFYLDGCYEAGIEKDTLKAIKYFEICLEKIDEAYLELIDIYRDKYKEERLDKYLDKINEYIAALSLKDDSYEEKIGKKMSNLIKEKLVVVKKV